MCLDACMGPRKIIASKKKKIAAGTSFTPRPRFRAYNNVKFLGPEQEDRKWKKMDNLPINLNYEIIWEFYANGIPIKDQPHSFMTMVRGRDISFFRDSIKAHIGNPLTFEEGELDEFAKCLARGNCKVNLVTDALMEEGKSYETNSIGDLKKFKRKNLRTIAQVMITLVLHNIRPISHT
ncbi:hypothetical protein RYX36_036249 [Vicia faba]